MKEISIPGFGNLALKHIVMDYNGTIAKDGILIPGLDDLFTELSGEMRLHVLTADTFGGVKEQLADLPVTLTILSSSGQDVQKAEYVENLGKESCVSLGNGRNDRLMLKTSALGIALLQDEGASIETLLSADIICKSIDSALELLTHPDRIRATLRM